jgi:hypothetical protein
MHMSHGASGKEWDPADQFKTKKTIRKTALGLAKLVIGTPPVEHMVHRLTIASITQFDITEDIDLKMDLLSVVAPREKYGIKRVRYFEGTVTWYWGRRGGFVKDIYGKRVLDDDGKEVYERPTAKQIRVYDKRAQMLDERRIDIGKESTRVEITLSGNRTIRQNLGFGTLQEYLDLDSDEIDLRLRALFDELTVTTNGQRIDPFTPEQKLEAEGNLKLSKKLRRNERRRERRMRETLGATEKNEPEASLLFLRTEIRTEYQRDGSLFAVGLLHSPGSLWFCPGAGGPPGVISADRQLLGIART